VSHVDGELVCVGLGVNFPVNMLPFNKHPSPVTAKVTAPTPDPPDIVSAIGTPAVLVAVVLPTESAS